ncbi:MAG: DUF1849 family protein [Alphaproteobacteria bacterium]|nr:DUF1849 family protein [Alphaproteobacteria bacterium]
MHENRSTSPDAAVLAAIAFGLLAASAAPAASADVDLVPHRGFYAMKLGDLRKGSTVTDVRGGLAFEWGMSCDGFTVQQRAQMQFSYNEGQDRDIGWTFATWESRKADRYRFTMRKTRDGSVYEEVRGDAELRRPRAAGSARFRAPEAKTLALPVGSMFPTEHTVALILAAREKRVTLLRRVFDGASMETATEINAIIGPRMAPGEGLPKITQERLGSHALLQSPAWTMRLAFYSSDDEQESLPEHEQTLVLQDNGIVRRLVLDYGDFTVDAALVQLTQVPKPKC